jgi:homoserine kinase
LAMVRGFTTANTKCQTVICKPSKGAIDKRRQF